MLLPGIRQGKKTSLNIGTIYRRHLKVNRKKTRSLIQSRNEAIQCHIIFYSLHTVQSLFRAGHANLNTRAALTLVFFKNLISYIYRVCPTHTVFTYSDMMKNININMSRLRLSIPMATHILQTHFFFKYTKYWPPTLNDTACPPVKHFTRLL